jgi:hypothetical protein
VAQREETTNDEIFQQLRASSKVEAMELHCTLVIYTRADFATMGGFLGERRLRYSSGLLLA